MKLNEVSIRSPEWSIYNLWISKIRDQFSKCYRSKKDLCKLCSGKKRSSFSLRTGFDLHANVITGEIVWFVNMSTVYQIMTFWLVPWHCYIKSHSPILISLDECVGVFVFPIIFGTKCCFDTYTNSPWAQRIPLNHIRIWMESTKQKIAMKPIRWKRKHIAIGRVIARVYPFKLKEKSGTIVFSITTMQLSFNAVARCYYCCHNFAFFYPSFGFYCAFTVACGWLYFRFFYVFKSAFDKPRRKRK